MIHLGIDFGTANTRVSVYHPGRIPEPVGIARGPSVSRFIMPSSCLITSDGGIEVGESVLSRPGRQKFIKRYWQQRPEDRDLNRWVDGNQVIGTRTYTCEQMVGAVIAEAVSRTFAALDIDPGEGFSANIVCPITFDLGKRNALINILSNRGARSVTLSNVVDEPLASAVLYGRVATQPPVNKNLLVFDAGAGTVDLAIVRYKHTGSTKSMVVLAEQGRCRAGSDLDRCMEHLVLKRIAEVRGVTDTQAVYAAYSIDPAAGRIMFEEECEQRKIQLSESPELLWQKENFLGRDHVEFQITREEFATEARPIINEFEDVVRAVLREATSFVQDFDGVDIILLVGGTSRLPFVRECIERHCAGAVVEQAEGYFDPLLATVRGVGFNKDFEDLVIKRPPYTTELRVVLADGSAQNVLIHQAFDKLYPFWQTFVTAVPYKEVRKEFASPIETVTVRFISPSEGIIEVDGSEFPPTCLQGENRICVRLDVQAKLRIEGSRIQRTVRMPYFSQVGLRQPPPFDPRTLNAPDIYPDDN